MIENQAAAKRPVRAGWPGWPVAAGTVLAVLALVLVSCSPASGASGRPGPPPANSGTRENRAIPASISQLPFTDQHGRTFTLGSLVGRTVMVVPFLTLCSDICPMTTGNLVQVEQALHRDGAASKVDIVEVTVDPGRDTPARLAAYARVANVSWELATETPAELTELAAFFGFYYQQVPEDDPPDIDWLTGKPLTYDITHSDGYVLINPRGRQVFENNAAPDFHGTLPPTLRRFLSAEGVDHLKHPPQPVSADWTPGDALTALAWVVGRPLPATG